MQQEIVEITDEKHWDQLWQVKEKSKGIFDTAGVIKWVANNLSLHLLFRRYLVRSDNIKAIEIGCGGGRWLSYFHKEFGFRVYGVDRSEVGCRLAEDFMAKQGIEATIIQADALSERFQSEYREFFDVVYSMGVIEHFEDCTDIIGAHVNLVRPGGTLIVVLPNFGRHSLLHWIAGLIGSRGAITLSHNLELMELSNLRSYFDKFQEIDIQHCDYNGPINIAAVPWPSSHFGKLSTPLFALMHLLNQILGYATFPFSSKWISSLIVLVASKKE